MCSRGCGRVLVLGRRREEGPAWWHTVGSGVGGANGSGQGGLEGRLHHTWPLTWAPNCILSLS